MNRISANSVKSALRNHHFNHPADEHPLLYINCVGQRLTARGLPDTPDGRRQVFFALASEAVWARLLALRGAPATAAPPKGRDLASLREELDSPSPPDLKALALLHCFYFIDGRVTVLALANGTGYSVDYLEKLLRSGRHQFAEILTQIEQRASIVTASGEQTVLTKLPPETVPLVDRELEMQQLMRLVPTRRLVTMVGAPGVGKTSLALAYARGIGASFPGGVYFVDLTSISDGSEPSLLNAIATAVGVPEDSQAGLFESLVSWLDQPDASLWLLDNFEHVAESAPVLVRLLHRAPGLCILATSRQPLHLSIEQQLPLAPLALPAHADGDVSWRSVRESPAVKCFEYRARMVLPDFSVSPENAALVADICDELDGLPLAIDLAARHLELGSLEDLRTALTAQLDALTGGARDLPRRHWSMEAAISLSFERLGASERLAFESLSAFASQFSTELAVKLAQGATGGRADSEQIDALRHRNLVEEAGPGRLRLLRVVREFARAQAERRGWWNQLVAEHREIVLADAAEHTQKLATDAAHPWIERLSALYPDLRMIMQQARDAADSVVLGRCIATLWRFYKETGQLSEARLWIDAVFQLVGPDIPRDPVWIEVYKGAAAIAHYQGDIEVAADALATSLSLARQVGSDLEVAAALSNEAMFLHYLGRVNEAERQLDEAVAILQQVDPPQQLKLAAALNSRADLFRERGRYAEAERDFAAGQALVQEINALWAAGMAFNRGYVALMRGDLAAAQAIGMSARQAFKNHRSPLNEALACSLLAAVELRRNNIDAAKDWVLESNTLNTAVDDHWQEAGNRMTLGQLAMAEGDVDQAETHFAACHRLFTQLEYPFGVLSSELELARIAGVRGDAQSGLALLRRSFVAARRLDARHQLCGILQIGAALLSERGHEHSALQLTACADVLRERFALHLSPTEEAARTRVLAQAYAMLGETAASFIALDATDDAVLDAAHQCLSAAGTGNDLRHR